jgi:hypothetical protein
MSAHPSSRLPARVGDDELAPDRSAPQAWHDARPDVQPEARQVFAAPAARSASPLDVVSRAIGVLLKLTLLLILLALLWGLVSLIGVGVRTPTAIGEQLGSAIERSAGAVGAVGQRVADAFDPAHPPRSPLAQDVEIDELLRLDVGAQVAGSSTRVLTVASIQRRADPAGPDGAVYAVLHGELREPQETKVLGLTVRSTRDPQDYNLYRGESLRIGRRLYKVNWVSIERQQLALVAYRDQDRVSAPLKVEID